MATKLIQGIIELSSNDIEIEKTAILKQGSIELVSNDLGVNQEFVVIDGIIDQSENYDQEFVVIDFTIEWDLADMIKYPQIIRS